MIIVLAMLAVAVYGLIVSANLIRKIMCLAIIEGVIILGFLTAGYSESGYAPILPSGGAELVDPIPQALMLTAIVIGVCFNSLALVFVVRLFQQKGTIDTGDLDE